jgi:hypothetical protein
VGETENAYRILIGKPEGKRSLRINRRIILKLILGKYNGRTLTGLISLCFVNTAMNLWVLLNC